jgi:hypothetical protein
MANPPGYFEKYYEENKVSINDKRKERYHNDPDYRDRVLKASQDYRDKKREEQGPRCRVPRYQIPLIRKVRGGKIQLFSVGFFALHLGRSVQSINHWEKSKPHPILPVTPYRDKRGFRYYTMGMMDVVKRVIGEKRRLFPVDEEMYQEIRSSWRGLGVPVNRKSLEPALAATVLQRKAS